MASAVTSFCVHYACNAYHGVCNGRPLWRVPLSIAWGMWPIFAWLMAFKKAIYIPTEWRPDIHTEWLPPADDFITSLPGTALISLLICAPLAWKIWISAADKMENASDPASPEYWWASKQKLAAAALLAYPAALSLLSFCADTQISMAKDIGAFVTYGALHFASPFLGAIFLWVWAPPEVAANFAWTLGFTNLASLVTHILFPNAAPWFRDLYGSPPDPMPSYTTLGNPAGLIRIDSYFGWSLYHKAFKISPIVFGAFPSVHSSTAMCCALFFSRYFKKPWTVAIIVYTSWMFWSTMYLRHHYAIDLLGGSCYCLAFFMLFREISLKKWDAIAESRDSTNGWQRIIWGYGSSAPTLPRTSPTHSGNSYQRVDSYPPEPKGTTEEEGFVLFDASKEGSGRY